MRLWGRSGGRRGRGPQSRGRGPADTISRRPHLKKIKEIEKKDLFPFQFLCIYLQFFFLNSHGVGVEVDSLARVGLFH